MNYSSESQNSNRYLINNVLKIKTVLTRNNIIKYCKVFNVSCMYDFSFCLHIKYIKGGGGGGSPIFFVKLDFEIAVDQQTRACDQTFEGVPDSGCTPVPTGQPRPYLVNLWPNFAKSPYHAQNQETCSY